MAKKCYVGVENTYKILDYIQSSGTQYIDTGFMPNNNTRVVMDFQMTSGQALFGSRQAATSNNYALQLVEGLLRSDYNNAYTQTWAVDITARRTVDKNKETTTIDGVSKSYTNASFQSPVNMTLLALNNNGTVQWYASAKLYSCQIYDNGTLVRDYVPCKNDSNNYGLYDKVNGVFYGNKGTGSFAAGSETGETITNGVARKVKKGYVGIDGLARKIKKAYIGIGGVARPCWSGGEPAYYGTITAPNGNAYLCGAVNVGNYAMFAGGYRDQSNTTAYNSSLVRSTPTALSLGRWGLMSAKAGEYGVFAGGSKVTVLSSSIDTVDAYSSSLVRTVPSVLPEVKSSGAAGTIAGKALFAGGYQGTATYSSTVICYNESLTRSNVTSLTIGKCALSAANAGDYLLIAGGNNGSVKYSKVEAYSTSLTRTSGEALSSARTSIGATTNNNKAIFAGGYTTVAVSTVDSYNESLTRSTLTGLSTAMYQIAATTVEGFSFIGGGWKTSTSVSNVVNCYDSNLTRTITTNLGENTNAQSFVATNNGNYALFAGSHNTSGRYSTMDVYTVA